MADLIHGKQQQFITGIRIQRRKNEKNKHEIQINKTNNNEEEDRRRRRRKQVKAKEEA